MLYVINSRLKFIQNVNNKTLNFIVRLWLQIIMKLNAVKVLNLLGAMDYRVIGTSSPDKKQLIWTLEHKDFEKLRHLQENDLDHQAHSNGGRFRRNNGLILFG